MKRLERPSDEIPTSSMADIAFLLIIYFMITMTLTTTRGLDFAMPPEEHGVVDPVESILVEIEPGGRLVVDGQPCELARLIDLLAPKLERAPHKPVIVRPAPRASYGSAVDVLDELRAGRERLGLAHDINIALPTQREIDRFWH